MRRLFGDCVAFLVILTSITTGSVRAQTPAPTNEPKLPPLPPQEIVPPTPLPPLPEKPPSQLPTPEEILPPPSKPTSPGGELPSTEETITVTEFRFTGNTAFTSEELAQITADLTNKPLPLSRLLQLASEVTSLYAERGYLTSGAIISIPESTQMQGEGVVEIQVIEGELEEIQVFPADGSLRLNPNYVRSRLELAADKPLNVGRLQEALLLLQLDPLIARVSAALSAGSRPGQSVLEVEVVEAPSFNFQAIADNNRSPSIGSFQRGGRVSEANLLGLGDELSLSRSQSQFETGDRYQIPLSIHKFCLCCLR